MTNTTVYYEVEVIKEGALYWFPDLAREASMVVPF